MNRGEEKKNKTDEVSDKKTGASLVKYAIIVAGGSGLRAGGEIPKQFQLLAGRPMLWYSMREFKREDPDVRLILVLNESYVDLWNEIYMNLSEDERYEYWCVAGGKTRYDSVKNGLSLIPSEREERVFVAVHDAARPLVNTGLIRRGWLKSMETGGGVVPVIPVTDSLRIKISKSSKAVDRSLYMCVQTPQIFPLELLRSAYGRDFSPEFTDDASVVENLGESVQLYEGDCSNIKVTNPEDFAIAELLMKRKVRD